MILGWHDLEFRNIAVDFPSMLGVPQTRLVPVGMPKISERFIHGVFYLYRSKEDALEGTRPGGTGFVVSYTVGAAFPGGYRDDGHYGITNWHVACHRGFSVIRLNTKDGGTDIIDLGPEDWHFLPHEHDVAVVPLRLDPNVHEVASTHVTSFLSKSLYSGGGLPVSIGDDVFMVGLFVDHAGVATNVPSARFGNISMLPNPRAKVKQPTGYLGESFIVDMHSRTGFSGSPVYVYRTLGNDLEDNFFGEDVELTGVRISDRGDDFRGRLRVSHFFRFLGIHWGQFPERWELRNASQMSEANGLVTNGGYVEGMSGMTCVIPAWDILEVLNMPKLAKLREDEERVAKAGLENEPKPEAAPNDENPGHKEDFTHLLNAAATPKKSGD